MAGRQPNFKTDVNRMKTQKWAQASRADYGGDDWGGYGGFDDYDDYEEEPPPPPKPTGLRQRGQGTATSSPDRPNFASDQPARGPTSSFPQAQASQLPQRPRAGSFEAGDDSHLVKDASFTAPNQAAYNPTGQSPRSPPLGSTPTMSTSSKPPTQPSASSQPPHPVLDQIDPIRQSSHDAFDERHSSVAQSPFSQQTMPSNKQSSVPQPPRSPPVMQGPYMGPGSGRPQASQTPPRGDSRGPPLAGRLPAPGSSPVLPPGAFSRPPQGQSPNLNEGRPFGPPRTTASPSAHEMYARRERAPSNANNFPQSQRSRPPPPQGFGTNRQTSQEYVPRRVPSEELRSRPLPPQDLRPRQSPSQEFRPPPRKESLTSNLQPSLPPSQGATPHQHRQDPSAATLEHKSSPTIPSSHEEPVPNAATFVRPADIYRRVEQEKERQRQSMDSASPSLDSLEPGGRPSSRGAAGSRTSQDSARETGVTGLPKSTLDPVAERKSEYGLEGLLAQDPALAKVISEQGDTAVTSLEPPSLPHVERFSGFGMEDFMGDNKPAAPSQVHIDSPEGAPTTGTRELQGSSQTIPHAQEDDLQHQPSLGFRTAVNEAFDGDHQSTLSPTHNSRSSRGGSDMSRSNTTDSTAGISPIMSRVPSAATAERRYRDADVKMTAPESIQEEAYETSPPNSRPDSTGTLRGPQPTSAPSSADNSRTVSQDSASLKSGYRRSMRPPSPGKSPAHLTAISARKAMEQHSQEGELEVTTPIDVSREASNASQEQQHVRKVPDPYASNLLTRESDIAAAATTDGHLEAIAKAEIDAQNNFVSAHKAIEKPTVSTDFAGQGDGPVSRSDSPSKGRVRDLASKYNDIHGTNKARASSPSGSISSWTSSNKPSPTTAESEQLPQSNTLQTSRASKNESSSAALPRTQDMAELAPPIRPTLPGGWISYNPSETSDAHSLAPSSNENYESATEQDQKDGPQSHMATPKANQESSEEPLDFSPTTTKQPLAGKTFPVGSETPMTALSAAGAALADSVKHMMGAGDDDRAEGNDFKHDMRARSTTDTTVRPGLISPDEVTTSASSVAPTPPHKNFPPGIEPRRVSGYFPPATPLNVRKAETPPGGGSMTREPDSATTATSATSTHLSLEPSASDTEADRLRKDIARSLSPPETSSGGLGALGTVDERQSAVSSVFPHEYDAYWANQEAQDTSPGTHRLSSLPLSGRSSSEIAKSSEAFDVEPLRASRLPNAQRSSLLGAGDNIDKNGNEVNDLKGLDPASLSSRPGPEHSGPAELDSATTELQKVSPLHEIPPNPVELPTPEEPSSGPRQSTDKALPSAPMTGRKRADTATAKDHPKPATFREIMNMKGQRERISAFSAARNQLGEQPTGLNDWIMFMTRKHPEHANSVAAPMRPLTQNTGIAGSVRNKMPPSIAKLGKTNSSGFGSLGSTPEGGSPSSPQVRENPSGSRRQDLLQHANMFGGKASQGAKGLFAKGKSRFRGVSSEKANIPSSFADREPRVISSSPEVLSSLEPTHRQGIPSSPHVNAEEHVATRDNNPGSRQSKPNVPSESMHRQPSFGNGSKLHMSDRSLTERNDSQKIVSQIPKPESESEQDVYGRTAPHAETAPLESTDRIEMLPANTLLALAISAHAKSNPNLGETSADQPELPQDDHTSASRHRIDDLSYSTLEVATAPHTGYKDRLSGNASRDTLDSEQTAAAGQGQFGVRGYTIWDDAAKEVADQAQALYLDPRTARAPSRTQSQVSASMDSEHMPRTNAIPPPVPAQPYGYWRHSYDTLANSSILQHAGAAVPQQSNNVVSKEYGDQTSLNMPKSSTPDRTRKMSNDIRRPPVPAQTPSFKVQRVHNADPMPTLPKVNPGAQDEQPIEQQPTVHETGGSQHYRSMSVPATSASSIPPALPDSSPIERKQRHYARGIHTMPSSAKDGENFDSETKPPIPQRSRNRLSRRSSTQDSSQISPAEDPPPIKVQRKRSSVLGTILRRSDTSKIEGMKSKPNKLRKANTRKSRGTMSEQIDSKDVPTPPQTVLRSPEGVPRLPNLNDNGGRAAHREASDLRVGSGFTPPIQEHAGYYNSGQTPIFEIPPVSMQSSPAPTPPIRDAGRAQHISYLQSQNMFGARQSPATVVPSREASPFATQATAQSQRLGAPHRVPSGASSVYTTRQDDPLQHHASTASSHYSQAGDFARHPTRPLTQAYTQFMSGPYDDPPRQRSGEQPQRRQTMPPSQSSYGYFPPVQQPGLAQMYADARRPRG